MNLEIAYAQCREIAKREAKNFYYSFVALPPAKRNAICAVYAFMRRADDISDDETMPHPQRRSLLEGWMQDWRRAQAGAATDDPVFVALRDAAARFRIPSELLEQLVAGTAMDLDPDTRQQFDTYATFEDLYQYCYLVASVVGLVVIRIFGYTDPRAEKLAEETGIAFQLTNILRDVREDAERHRIYLPQDEMTAHGVTEADLLAPTASVPVQALLRSLGDRAEKYYGSADRLLPMIDADSRPALGVLVAIYHRLLRRIEKSDYEVLQQRHSVSTVEKLAILGKGMASVVLARVGVGR